MKPAVTPAPRDAGFSLIELLISMVIALVVTLAITSVLLRSEGSKRGTTSVNDLNQTGAYAAFVLERAIRNAGSGLSQRWSDVYGCLLDVSKDSAPVLPMATAFPDASAFSNVKNITMAVRLAPVIIGKSLADTTGVVRGDVLMVMGGGSGRGEAPHPVLPPTPVQLTQSNVRLANTLVYRSNDLVLLADTGVPGGCMVQQVLFPGTSTGSLDQSLPLGGTYFASTGTHVDLDDFGASTVAMQLGNADDNPPQFQLYGVGANHSLNSHDLLQPVADGVVPDVAIADGVVEMRALYGIDTSAGFDGTSVTWIDPIPASGYEATVLTDGSTTSRTKLRRIVSIRLGFILRTSQEERPQPSMPHFLPEGTALTLFGDLRAELRRTRTLAGNELNYRHRTVEITVPLRNVLLAPTS